MKVAGSTVQMIGHYLDNNAPVLNSQDRLYKYRVMSSTRLVFTSTYGFLSLKLSTSPSTLT